MRYVGDRTEPEFIRWRFEKLTSQYERGFGHWAVLEAATGSLVGAVGLLDHDDWTATPYSLEVGWLIAQPFWNKGFATEAGRASVTYAFEETGAEHLICIVDPRNGSSRRVAEKLGMRLTGETIWREKNVVWYERSSGRSPSPN